LAMMLACEGYITWAPLNEDKTDKPTTAFRVCLLTTINKSRAEDIESRLAAVGFKASTKPYTNAGQTHIDKYGRFYVNRADAYRTIIYDREDTEKFLRWIGRIPCPIKEAYRLWSLRVVDKHKDRPIYWSEVQLIKERLENYGDMTKANGRKRAKAHFDRVQTEMDSGLRRDTRPHGAQTAPFTTNRCHSRTGHVKITFL